MLCVAWLIVTVDPKIWKGHCGLVIAFLARSRLLVPLRARRPAPPDPLAPVAEPTTMAGLAAIVRGAAPEPPRRKLAQPLAPPLDTSKNRCLALIW